MKVALILLNWNNAPDTLECLASISRLDYPLLDVIVVDNGSTDGSLEKIKKTYPQHHYIENGENLGFAQGNNRGLEEGIRRGADLLFLLNNDTVLAPNAISEIVKTAQKYPQSAVFGPKIFFYDEPATIWYAGGGVSPHTGRCYHIGWGGFEGHDAIKETDYICGCALAIRSRVIEQVGLMDPDFFLIWEEIDWCTRIRKAGYTCLFVPNARVWHKVSSSFVEGNRGPMWQYYYHRNRLLYHHRHGYSKKWLAKEAWGLIKLAVGPKHKRARAALWGTLDYYLNNFGKGRLGKFTHKR